MMYHVNISLFIEHKFTSSSLAETLNFDDNEDTNQCSSQQGLIRTYQLSNRQPAARFINDARAVLNDGSRYIGK